MARDYDMLSGCSGMAAVISIVIAVANGIAEEPRIGLPILCAIIVPILALWGISTFLKHLANCKKDYKQTLDREYQIATKSKIKECDDKIKECDNKIDECNNKIKDVEGKEHEVHSLLISSQPFKNSATMKAEVASVIFEKEKNWLVSKSHPAYTAAKTVSELKKQYKSVLQDSKEKQYKWEFLLSVFPELQKYVDDDAALMSLSVYNNVEEFSEDYDHTRDFLSDEEWRNKSVDERNQLALDRYKKSANKSAWVVGVEYESYVSFYLKSHGYRTIEHGALKGIEDLGRDIIAEKTLPDGSNETYIIQCKRWSTKNDKMIHENVVCQTFGTAVEYEIQNKGLFTKVIPAIYTTGEYSDMAEKFAERLGVQLIKLPMGEYPCIKCNINNGSKIYHLPFDQQYYRTVISLPGEFYAWTVAEATSKGFRRAFRHINN